MKTLLLLILSTRLAFAGQPDILFIITDDQAHDAIGALGDASIKTPNLDRLVSEGTSFTNAYNMGAWHGAVCVASRTMLLTGRSLWHARRLDNQRAAEGLVERSETWPQLLKKAGYETYFSGKWHTAVDPRLIFEHVANVRPGMPTTVPASYNRPLADQPDPWRADDSSLGGYWEGGKHWSEVLADDAASFLLEASKKKNPFLLFLAFNAPHDPRQSPREFLDRYPVDDIRLPANFLPENPHMEAMGLLRHPEGRPRWLLRDEHLAPYPRTELAVKTHLREYHALISHLDAQVGRILDALEKSGRRENTLIIFTSDHGLACGRHGLMGKQNMFEHSLKPPLILAGPGIPKGEKRTALVHMQDVLPTTLEAAGASVPDFVEFKSLYPLLRDPGAKGRDSIVAAYMNTQRMIRIGDDKLVFYPESETTLLFDLVDDPAELHDLADDKPELAAALLESLQSKAKALDDSAD